MEGERRITCQLYENNFFPDHFSGFLFSFHRKICESSDIKGNWRAWGGRERNNKMHSFDFEHSFHLSFSIIRRSTVKTHNCTLRNVKWNKLIRLTFLPKIKVFGETSFFAHKKKFFKRSKCFWRTSVLHNRSEWDNGADEGVYVRETTIKDSKNRMINAHTKCWKNHSENFNFLSHKHHQTHALDSRV